MNKMGEKFSPFRGYRKTYIPDVVIMIIVDGEGMGRLSSVVEP